MKLEKISFQVTIINPVAASIGEMLRSKIPVWLHLGVDLFLKGEKEKLFVTHTVGNILFNGFQDPLLNAMTDLKAILKEFVPDGAFMDKFAFFYARNGTDWVDGVFNMYTGAGNVQDMGIVHSWNYRNVKSRSIFQLFCVTIKNRWIIKMWNQTTEPNLFFLLLLLFLLS